MRSIKKVLNAPFPYFFNDEKKNLLLPLWVCIFLAAFMLTFNPRASQHPDKTALIVGFAFLVLFPFIVLAPRIFPTVFDSVNWTFGKHIAFTALVLLVTGMVITVGLFFLNYYPQLTFTQTLRHIYPDVFAYGMVPSTLITLIMRNQMLNENLKNALQANYELDKIQHLKGQTQAERDANTVIIHADTNEILRLNVADLLFVEADDNYSTFYWRKDTVVEKKMLRLNLKSVEQQLNNNFTVRCHRSFIVNVCIIETIAGNTNGYRLSIAGSDYSIPVSRSKGKEVIEKIRQVRSVMELQ